MSCFVFATDLERERNKANPSRIAVLARNREYQEAMETLRVLIGRNPETELMERARKLLDLLPNS